MNQLDGSASRRVQIVEYLPAVADGDTCGCDSSSLCEFDSLQGCEIILISTSGLICLIYF